MVRLHVVGLPHTGLEDRFSWCAYTGKVRRFAPMMTAQGFDVVTYHAGKVEQHDPWRAGEYVQILTERARAQRFGSGLPVPSFDQAMFGSFNAKACFEIGKRIQLGDLVLPLRWARAAPTSSTCSPPTGRRTVRRLLGVIPDGTFRCFESYVWMHAVYGYQAGAGLNAYLRPELRRRHPELLRRHPVPAPRTDDGYLLFVGRVGDYPKGIYEAMEVSKASGVPLVAAGPACRPKGWIIGGSSAPRIGPKLLTHCTALIQPTQFLEPFGGSVVEALLCGVPVITSDWGAFPENVIEPQDDRGDPSTPTSTLPHAGRVVHAGRSAQHDEFDDSSPSGTGPMPMVDGGGRPAVRPLVRASRHPGQAPAGIEL